MDGLPISEEFLSKWLIVLASMAVIYVSLGRATAFRYEKPARAIISIAVAITAVSAIGENWKTVAAVAGVAVTGAISSLLIYRVALQRGKTPHELNEDKEKEERKWQRDAERWRNENK